MAYNKFPAVDDTNKFPAVIRQAIASSIELINAFASKATETAYNAHAANVNNPHAVTKAQVGLSAVDNTSDMNKPVSTIQKAGLTPKWVAGASYAVGDQVTTPNNTIMSARVAHIASGAFSTDLSKWDGQTTGVPFAHMGRTAGFQSLTTLGVVVMTAAQEMRGGFAFDAATSSLIVPITGRYKVHVKGYFSGAASASNTVGIWYNGAWASASNPALQTIQSVLNKNDGGTDVQFHANALSVQLTAGDKVGVGAQSTAASVWGTNGYNGTSIELDYIGI